MSKKHRKSTMPAFIENQPIGFRFGCGDGRRHINETQKNERNRRRQISRPERPATIPKATKVTGTKPLIRSKTRIIVYRQVKNINN